jgi:hypothetical protein
LLNAKEALCWAASTLLLAAFFPACPLDVAVLALLLILAAMLAAVPVLDAACFALFSGEGVSDLLTSGRAPAEEGTGVVGLLLMLLAAAAPTEAGVGGAAAS